MQIFLKNVRAANSIGMLLVLKAIQKELCVGIINWMIDIGGIKMVKIEPQKSEVEDGND